VDNGLWTNLVVMGMVSAGELRHLLKAAQNPERAVGGGIGARKITIQRAGLAPQTAGSPPSRCKSALHFLHGATDAVRSRSCR